MNQAFSLLEEKNLGACRDSLFLVVAEYAQS
jgi:hypothetical protein